MATTPPGRVDQRPGPLQRDVVRAEADGVEVALGGGAGPDWAMLPCPGAALNAPPVTAPKLTLPIASAPSTVKVAPLVTRRSTAGWPALMLPLAASRSTTVIAAPDVTRSVSPRQDGPTVVIALPALSSTAEAGWRPALS